MQEGRLAQLRLEGFATWLEGFATRCLAGYEDFYIPIYGSPKAFAHSLLCGSEFLGWWCGSLEFAASNSSQEDLG